MKTNSTESDLMTTAEVAALLRVTTQTVTRWVAEKSIAAVRVKVGKGHRYLFKRGHVLAKMEAAGAEVAVVSADTEEVLKRHGLA